MSIAELWAALTVVMVVVPRLATCQPRKDRNVPSGVVEVFVAEPVTEPIDRRRDHEDIQERMDARC